MALPWWSTTQIVFWCIVHTCTHIFLHYIHIFTHKDKRITVWIKQHGYNYIYTWIYIYIQFELKCLTAESHRFQPLLLTWGDRQGGWVWRSQAQHRPAEGTLSSFKKPGWWFDGIHHVYISNQTWLLSLTIMIQVIVHPVTNVLSWFINYKPHQL